RQPSGEFRVLHARPRRRTARRCEAVLAVRSVIVHACAPPARERAPKAAGERVGATEDESTAALRQLGAKPPPAARARLIPHRQGAPAGACAPPGTSTVHSSGGGPRRAAVVKWLAWRSRSSPSASTGFPPAATGRAPPSAVSAPRAPSPRSPRRCAGAPTRS